MFVCFVCSFPLAYYSQDFIQVVVLGNDMHDSKVGISFNGADKSL